MCLRYVMYTSTAAPDLGDAELLGLLVRARHNNQALGITGVLVRRDPCFLQYLEGPAATLATLTQTIAADPRHLHFQIVAEGDLQGRQFSEWSMDLRGAHGADFLSDEELADDPEGIKYMLDGFATTLL